MEEGEALKTVAIPTPESVKKSTSGLREGWYHGGRIVSRRSGMGNLEWGIEREHMSVMVQLWE